MKKTILLAVAVVLALASRAPAQPGDTLGHGREQPMPPDLKVVLEPGKTNYFLGENIILYYRVTMSGCAGARMPSP
jgi:hypothetical protein